MEKSREEMEKECAEATARAVPAPSFLTTKGLLQNRKFCKQCKKLGGKSVKGAGLEANVSKLS